MCNVPMDTAIFSQVFEDEVLFCFLFFLNGPFLFLPTTRCSHLVSTTHLQTWHHEQIRNVCCIIYQTVPVQQIYGSEMKM